MVIEFTLNNEIRTIETHPARRLLDILRDDFGLTSVKEGCGEGECGACIVLLNGRAVNACLVPIGNIAGQSIITLEGFRNTLRYGVIADAFLEAGAVQCGFCTPGIVLATEALLNENPHPTEAEIKIGLSGNLCRCTGYQMIITAVNTAAERGAGLW